MYLKFIMNIKDNQQDYKDLKKAAELLTTPSIIAQISNIVGSPLEIIIEKLPTKVKILSRKLFHQLCINQ